MSWCFHGEYEGGDLFRTTFLFLCFPILVDLSGYVNI